MTVIILALFRLPPTQLSREAPPSALAPPPLCTSISVCCSINPMRDPAGWGQGWAPLRRGWTFPKTLPQFLISWVLGGGLSQAASGTLGASLTLE